MPSQTHILTDVENRVWVANFHADAAGTPQLPGDWSITKQTLRGGRSDGVDLIELNNGAFSISILPTRGMGLWKGDCRDVPVGWDSPVKQPVNPTFVDQNDRSGLGWLTGFNELLCRCGLASNGAPGTDTVLDNNGNAIETELTLHGKIANTPAHHVEIEIDEEDGGRLAVTGTIDETSLFGPCLRLTSRVETTVGSNRLLITDTITNLAGQPGELQLLYHTNIGRPFLERGARFAAPIETLAPRDPHASTGIDAFDEYDAPQAGYVEQAFLMELLAGDDGRTTTMLCNSARDRAVSLRFPVSELPCFTLWKNTQSEADGFVTGLEPATNFPNLKTYERQQERVLNLEPGQHYTTHLELSVHTTADEVQQVQSEIDAIQDQAAQRVHRHPIARFLPI
ncbi:MAG: DUF4432 domain-containing protein [Planctomycetaceae bacterium]|nr:DUF4432 domain-containing protein [Planctomycetaceae bacterium]